MGYFAPPNNGKKFACGAQPKPLFPGERRCAARIGYPPSASTPVTRGRGVDTPGTGGDRRSQHGAGGKERGEPGSGGGHRTACTAVGEIGRDGGKGREAGRGAHGARDGRTVTRRSEARTKRTGQSERYNGKEREAICFYEMDTRAAQTDPRTSHHHRPPAPHTNGPAPAQLPP